jgi:hypothetical protein
MSDSRKKAGVWICEIDVDGERVDQSWSFAQVSTPDILDLEYATVETELTQDKIRQSSIHQQTLGLKLTRAAADLERLKLRAAEAVDKGEPFELDGDLIEVAEKVEALSGALSEEQANFKRMSRFTREELEPYVAWGLDHTLDVSPLPGGAVWSKLSPEEQSAQADRLSARAAMHYTSTIVGAASLGHAKKKPTSTTSAASNSTRVNATSASARPTRKKRKKTGKSTGAKSRKSTRKSKS